MIDEVSSEILAMDSSSVPPEEVEALKRKQAELERKLEEEKRQKEKQGPPEVSLKELQARDEVFKAHQLRGIRQNLGHPMNWGHINPQSDLFTGKLEAGHIANAMNIMGAMKPESVATPVPKNPLAPLRAVGKLFKSFLPRR